MGAILYFYTNNYNMNSIIISGNYLIVSREVNLTIVQSEFPMGKTVYTELEDTITLLESSGGTVVIQKSDVNSNLWEGDAGVFDLLSLVTFLRANTGFNLPSDGGGGLSSVKYSTVAFVDNVAGDDYSGLIGIFDKPFFSIEAALNAISLTSRTKTNRGLVWVRKGEFNSVQPNPYNFCDVFCDAGVVFNGYFYLTDARVGATDFNWYGYAKWNLGMGSLAFRFQNASTVLIEGDSLVNLGAICLAFNVTVGTSNITFNFNSLESTQTLGSGFAFTWRNNCNATLNVKNYIKVNQVSHEIRANHSGTITVNCPRNIMTALNVYGGNFKNILSSSNSSATSYFTINGDLISETAYLGGAQSMILVWSSSQCQVTINGNVYANDSVGLWGANIGVGRIVLNGDLFSNINTIITQGNGLVVVKNGTIKKVNTSGNSIYMYGGTLYLMGCSLYYTMKDGTMIGLDAGGLTNLEVINCVSKSEGLLGEFVTSTVLKSCQFTNVVANKPLNVNVTNQLAQGLIIEPLLEVPRF